MSLNSASDSNFHLQTTNDCSKLDCFDWLKPECCSPTDASDAFSDSATISSFKNVCYFAASPLSHDCPHYCLLLPFQRKLGQKSPVVSILSQNASFRAGVNLFSLSCPNGYGPGNLGVNSKREELDSV